MKFTGLLTPCMGVKLKNPSYFLQKFLGLGAWISLTLIAFFHFFFLLITVSEIFVIDLSQISASFVFYEKTKDTKQQLELDMEQQTGSK